MKIIYQKFEKNETLKCLSLLFKFLINDVLNTVSNTWRALRRESKIEKQLVDTN
jgi:hypothetical protein